jgi:tripartite-type tricarboxylate transporter receptor subunit TctC
VKANADSLTLANAGIGAASHLCGMLLMQALEAPLVTVPYKGTGPAMTDLLGGQIDLMCDQTTNTANQIKAGEIKPYAVTTPERIALLPDTPTLAESGLEGFNLSAWHAIWAPAGTPDDVRNRLSEALQKALADPDVIDRLATLGTTPVAADLATPAAMDERFTSEVERWSKLLAEAPAN